MSSAANAPVPTTGELVAGIGNLEAKTDLMLYMGTLGLDTDVPENRLHDNFTTFVGGSPSWAPSESGLISYCYGSLEPIGQVAKVEIPSSHGNLPGVRLTEYGHDVGVSFAGNIALWGLYYTGISTQQVFGPSHSRTGVRAPANRILVLNKLLASDDPELALSYSAIGDLTGADIRSSEYKRTIGNVGSAASALQRHGFVRVERTGDANVRRFRIRELTPLRSDAGAVRRAMHGILESWFNQGRLEFTTDEMADAVAAHLSGGASHDQVDTRLKVIKTLGSSKLDRATGQRAYTFLPGVERLDVADVGEYTQVTLVAQHIGALRELMRIVAAVETGDADMNEEGRLAAEMITEDTSLKVALLEKSHDFSPNAQNQLEEETMQEVIALLENIGGAADAETIAGIYAALYDRSLTPASIQRIMRRLTVDGGPVIVASSRHQASSRRQQNVYSLAEDYQVKLLRILP